MSQHFNASPVRLPEKLNYADRRELQRINNATRSPRSWATDRRHLLDREDMFETPAVLAACSPALTHRPQFHA